MRATRTVFALSIALALGVAAQAGAQTRTPTQAQAQTRAATPAPPSSVAPVTVQPQTQPQGRVVSSTDATSLTSPNYSADDAAPAPRALSLGGNSALGVEAADSAPLAGLPASQAGPARHSDIGVTTVF